MLQQVLELSYVFSLLCSQVDPLASILVTYDLGRLLTSNPFRSATFDHGWDGFFCHYELYQPSSQVINYCQPLLNSDIHCEPLVSMTKTCVLRLPTKVFAVLKL